MKDQSVKVGDFTLAVLPIFISLSLIVTGCHKETESEKGPTPINTTEKQGGSKLGDPSGTYENPELWLEYTFLPTGEFRSEVLGVIELGT